MKNAKMSAILFVALTLIVCRATVSSAVPMGTAWTYQGRLIDANYPADGLYDFEFKLFDDPCLGTQQGGAIEVNDLDVVDGYFTVELDFGGGVFEGDARWLEIGVRPGEGVNLFDTLWPRQPVTPTAYALYAESAGTDNDWIVSGSMMYSVPRRVGIGTTDPGGTSLFVERPSSVSPYVVWQDGLVIKNGERCIGNQLEIQDSLGDTQLVFTGTRLGIGTDSPGTGLHVKGTGWPDAFMSLQSDPNQDAGIRLYEGDDVKWHFFNEWGTDGLSLRNTAFSSVLFADQETGDIGLGTTGPRTDLEILGTTGLRVTTGQHSNVFGDFRHDYSGGLVINAHAGGGGWADMSLQTNATTRLFIESGGNVGIGMGTEVPPERLTVRGNILVQSSSGVSVAEIGEGLDYAEGFDVTEEADIESGTVLVIDSDNPGKLTVSRSAYDSKVAGIVAGGKGLGSGVRLGVGQFDYDVALAGRVFCNVDATETEVQAGDLLTTSSKPGYAMKATDYERARGAILGKAMQGIEQGQKGQILVLVTLQ
jgi:hypothetical protein